MEKRRCGEVRTEEKFSLFLSSGRASDIPRKLCKMRRVVRYWFSSPDILRRVLFSRRIVVQSSGAVPFSFAQISCEWKVWFQLKRALVMRHITDHFNDEENYFFQRMCVCFRRCVTMHNKDLLSILMLNGIFLFSRILRVIFLISCFSCILHVISLLFIICVFLFLFFKCILLYYI